MKPWAKSYNSGIEQAFLNRKTCIMFAIIIFINNLAAHGFVEQRQMNCYYLHNNSCTDSLCPNSSPLGNVVRTICHLYFQVRNIKKIKKRIWVLMYTLSSSSPGRGEKTLSSCGTFSFLNIFWNINEFLLRKDKNIFFSFATQGYFPVPGLRTL